MRAHILHDSVGVFVVEENNHLFSRWTFCCSLDLLAFCGWFIKSRIVNLNDFLIWEGREGFLYLKDVDCRCCNLCKRLRGVCSTSVLGYVIDLTVFQLLKLFLRGLRWDGRQNPFDWMTVGVA